MTALDWVPVVFMLAIMVAGLWLSRGQMRSVADFLAAGRTADRYLVSVASGVAALGAITVIGNLEMNYAAGLPMTWWGLTMSVVVLCVHLSGWVLYRFRETRCLTLAEFFERRYSRNFRVFAGLVAFVAGIVNFGIFPAVGTRFFIAYCGFPAEFVPGGPDAADLSPADGALPVGGPRLRLPGRPGGGDHHRLHAGRLREPGLPGAVRLPAGGGGVLGPDLRRPGAGPGRRLAHQPVPYQRRPGLQLLVLPDRRLRRGLRADVVAGHAGLQRVVAAARTRRR